mgnify:CR=1 FL=1
MVQSAELLLDSGLDTAVRREWAALSDAGLPSQNRHRGESNRPHITVSVGWIGAVMAYLALVVAAMSSQDSGIVRAAWTAMELIGWYVIVPLAIAALDDLAAGLAQRPVRAADYAG